MFLRGNPESHGDLVPKAFPVILAGEQQPADQKGQRPAGTGRLAREPGNPLPARVMVNRIWQGHFGEGIVRTANNFGIVGERPSHPELLDWLAAEFIAQGWSVKKMHRLIMLSSAYQMSSEITPEKQRERMRTTGCSRVSQCAA